MGMLSSIGNTPLVRLERLSRNLEVYAKLEMNNPTGSTKDRPAMAMISHGIETGEISSGSTVIESTSGNLGLSLAMVCGLVGVRFVAVVDDRTSRSTLVELEERNSKVVRVKASAGISPLESRLSKLSELKQENPEYYWTNQYGNPCNWQGHMSTMQEIVDSLGVNVDYCFVGVSTCGTLRGYRTYANSIGLKTKFVAVDAVGSILFDGTPGPRALPGLGISIIPKLYDPTLADFVIRCGEADCINGCHELLQKEQIFSGASSGAIVHAFRSIESELPSNSRVVLILHDHGNRYMDTIYNPKWRGEFNG